MSRKQKSRIRCQESSNLSRIGNKQQDPDDEDGFPDLIDPDDEDGFPDLIDPDDEDGFPDLIDPSVRRKTRRRLRNAPLCGDYPTGQSGNVRRSTKPELTGKIVVRLAPKFALAPDKTLEELATRLDLQGLLNVLEKYELTGKSRRLVARRGSQEAYDQAQDPAKPADPDATPNQPANPDFTRFSPEPQGVTPDEIVKLEDSLATHPLAPLHSLATYWRLDANHRSGKLRKILKRLNRLAEVSLAYAEVAATDPSNGMGDPYVGVQTYLDRAPYGIDARWARRWGGDGSGVALVDMEQGWMPRHPELAPVTPMLIHGNNRDGHDGYKGHHGTAVLGEIIAAANDAGVVGIAPGVSKVGLASHFHSEPENGGAAAVPKTDSHVAEAIYAAISAPEGERPFLNRGDVLLIEVQRAYLPTEVDPADFDAIRLASALGIIVVEAAGNGGRNLDHYQDARGAIFNRRRGGRESGAIMVGAALGALPHNRKRASNYGSRIDCYAWGNRVVTAGYGDLPGGGRNATYTADFSNTSAAAPIIAGAALILQGMYQRATGGRRLAPGQMRALLADPATGTRQGRGVPGHIGVMPNLRAIVEHTLRIVPDVYMRDSLDDTGGVPATGRVCACPDVLVSRTQRSNPVRAFGQGSGTENDPALAYKAVAGRENFIYVRMKNRGLGDAEKMRATVYWTEAATLSTPDRWREIGASEPIQVPQGDTLAVAGPISWRSVPKSEIYCLVTFIEDTGEPTRLPPGLLTAEGGRARQKRLGQESEPPRFDWLAFLAFLRNHNHLAVRNFHVVDEIPAAGTPKELDFLITGTPAGDRGRFFDLEILQSLPKKADLYFDVPMTLAPAVSGSPWRSEINGRFLRFHLPSLPRVPFCKVPLSAGAEHGCRFVVVGADGMESGGHGLAIRQLYRGQEVGRVSWQFHRASGRLRRRLRSRR